MNDHRHGAVMVVKWIAKVWIKIFQAICKSSGQAIYAFRINHSVIGSFELVPIKSACVLAIFIKLSSQADTNEQKQDDEHPAFENLVIY